MSLILTGDSSYAQFITVLILFVLVLTVTLFVTKYLGNTGMKAGTNSNIKIVDSARIANNIYVQIIKVGNKYKAIAVAKDSVEYLGEVEEEELNLSSAEAMSFKDLFEKIKKNSSNDDKPEE